MIVVRSRCRSSVGNASSISPISLCGVPSRTHATGWLCYRRKKARERLNALNALGACAVWPRQRLGSQTCVGPVVQSIAISEMVVNMLQDLSCADQLGGCSDQRPGCVQPRPDELRLKRMMHRAVTKDHDLHALQYQRENGFAIRPHERINSAWSSHCWASHRQLRIGRQALRTTRLARPANGASPLPAKY